MAFPTTITTGGDVNVGGGIPYLSSSGNVYVIVRDDTTLSKFRAFKATDPASSFSNVGTDPQVTSTNTVQALATTQVGDVIHVATLDYVSVATIDIRYHTFSMSSDSWTLTNETVKDNYAVVDTGLSHVHISTRSNGDVIIFYNGPKVANMGSDRDRVYYARRVSGSWTVDTIVDNGGATHWYTGGIVPGSSDRHHLFFWDQGVSDAYQRCLRSANTLETFPTAFDTTLTSNTDAMIELGVSYDASGTQKVRFPYQRVVSTDLSSAKMDSADTPTVTEDNDITGATNVAANLVNLASFSADGTTLWNTFIENGFAIYTQSNANDGGWSTPALFYSSTTVGRIYTNIYTRAGDIVLGIVFSETDPKYHEKVLLAGDTSAHDVDLDCQFDIYKTGHAWR